MIRRTGLVLALLAAALPAACPADQPVEPIKAITSPSLDLTLSFTRAGRVEKVLVRPGQKVRAGSLLACLENSVERKQLALLKAQADDTTALTAAETRLRRAKSDLEKIEKAYAAKAAPRRELEEAQLDADMARLELDAARFQHAQDTGKYEKAQLDLLRMQLLSPADGEIEEVIVKAGESVDALAPVLRLVSVNPLWIDAPVPLKIGRRLKAGSNALVQLPGVDKPAAGKVIHVSRVADPASETLEVRVELPNPSARFAGEHVTVTFPEEAKPSSPKSD